MDLFRVSLEQTEPLPGIQASRVTWGASVEGTARELLSDPNQEDDAEQSAVESASEFLTEMLKDCAVWTKELEKQAKDAGVSWRTVRRASEQMDVVKRKAAEGRWYWSLRPLVRCNSANLSNLSNVLNVDNLDNMDNMAISGGPLHE